MKKIRFIYDFFKLWIKWGDRKEAWEDARFIHDDKIQAEMTEIVKELEDHIKNLQLKILVTYFVKKINDTFPFAAVWKIFDSR